jgi:hypothetical protein
MSRKRRGGLAITTALKQRLKASRADPQDRHALWRFYPKTDLNFRKARCAVLKALHPFACASHVTGAPWTRWAASQPMVFSINNAPRRGH